MARPGNRLRNSLVLAVALSVGAVIVIFVATMDHETWKAIGHMSPWVFIILLGLMVCRWMATCWRTDLLIRAMGARMKFGRVVKGVLSGGFAGAITPYHSAGIPVEIYFLSHYGLPAGSATAVVTTGAAMSILLFVIAVPVVFAVSAATIEVSFGFRTLLVAAGVIAVFFFLIVAYSMKEPEKIAPFVRNVAPRRLLARPGFEKFLQKLVRGIGDFSSSFRTIVRAPVRLIVPIILLTLFFWASGMMVAPVILWGLGHPELFTKALLAQLVVSILLPFFPVPGESVMAEATFAGVFSVFVPRHLLGFLTLAWRFFMFYLIVFGLGVVFFIALRDAGKSAREFSVERLSAAPGVAGEEP